MKRNDNRGASFVMVVVAMAIVAVLAVTVLWIALMNLQMKVTDEKNTDNFYSAEGVLDQICTGLQGDISKAYSAGYTKVMENYSDSSINEAGRQSIFAQEYLKSLKGSLALVYSHLHIIQPFRCIAFCQILYIDNCLYIILNYIVIKAIYSLIGL